MPDRTTYYATGETTDAETTASVTLRDVVWLRRAIVAALYDLTRDENWTLTNPAQAATVADYANEVFESITFDPPPTPAQMFHLGAVTTAQAQTLVIQSLRSNAGAYTVYWGNGASNTYAAGYTGTLQHTYALAGVYEIAVHAPPASITYLHAQDAKLVIGVGTIGTFTALTVLHIDAMPAAYIAANEIAAKMEVSYLFVRNSPNVGRWDGLEALPILNYLFYQNSMTSNQVQSMLFDLWRQSYLKTSAGGTINVAGTNAVCPGIYQSVCPPTSGLEYRYQLLNDTCGSFIDAAKRWVTVTVN